MRAELLIGAASDAASGPKVSSKDLAGFRAEGLDQVTQMEHPATNILCLADLMPPRMLAQVSCQATLVLQVLISVLGSDQCSWQ